MSAPRMLTAEKVAERLSVTRKTVCIWAAQGYFPGAVRLTKPGKPATGREPLRIPERDVERYLARCEKASA